MSTAHQTPPAPTGGEQSRSILKRLVRRMHVHCWKLTTGTRPDRSDWFCHFRSCRCGRVEYHAFAVFGDKQWHDINDRTGCMSWEHPQLMASARHHGLQPNTEASNARERGQTEEKP